MRKLNVLALSMAILLLTAPVVDAAKKDRVWISGSVSAVEQIPGRVMQDAPANHYLIRTETTDYTLEHASRTYYTPPPTALLTAGETVELSLDGNHAILRTPSFQKRLRIIKSSIHPKR